MIQLLFWPFTQLCRMAVRALTGRYRRDGTGGYAAFDDHADSVECTQRWLYKQHGPIPAQHFTGGGGGMLATQGRLVVDAGGSGAGACTGTDSGALNTGLAQGHASLGLILLETPFFRVYPLVGMGSTGVIARIDSDTAGATSSSWFALLAHGGIGIDFTLRLGRIELFAGVRLGYQTSLASVQKGAGEYCAPPEGTFARGAIGARWLDTHSAASQPD